MLPITIMFLINLILIIRCIKLENEKERLLWERVNLIELLVKVELFPKTELEDAIERAEGK